MINQVGPVYVRVATTLLAASALAGCVDNGDSAFFILNNSAPGDTCSFTGDPSQEFLPSGHILTFSPTGYQLFPLLESKVTATDGQESQRTITIQEARVDLTIPVVTLTDASGATTNITDQQQAALDSSLTRFRQLMSAPLTPGGTVNVGVEIVPWGLIRGLTSGLTLGPGDRFNAVVVAKVVMHGEMGGREVESDAFTYPVTICNDCIANVIGPCPAQPLVAGHPCNPYQDGTVDCCMDASNQLVCPATP